MNVLRVSSAGMLVDERLFIGKRIAIVGPAQTVFDDLEDVDVDRYDLIVRLNNGVALARTAQGRLGRRTDVLFHNLKEEGERSAGRLNLSSLGVHRPRLLICPHWAYPRTVRRVLAKRRALRTEPDIEVRILPREFGRKLGATLGVRQPTVGAFAIAYLLSCEPKELGIFGFTFFQTTYAPGYNDEVGSSADAQAWATRTGIHDPEAERRYVAESLNEAGERGMSITLGQGVESRLYSATERA